MERSIHCTVNDQNQASQIVDSLKRAGFGSEDISILMADKGENRDFAEKHDTKAPEGAATGAGTGALLGGGLGWLAGIGTIAVPGVGALIAAGPIMAAISGAALGGTLGGISGALIGMGIPDEEAAHYETRVKSGRALISVHAESAAEAERAREILNSSGAQDVSAYDNAVGARR
jgi:hypothetical protein